MTFLGIFISRLIRARADPNASGFPPGLIGGIMWGMPDRPQKITFADMRDMGVRGLLIFAPITSAAT